MIEPETQSIRLRGFQPDRLEEVVRNSRLEHYILAPAECNAYHRRWAIGEFSVDIGRFSYPVRVLGDFPANHLCIGYMRSQTTETWVNGIPVDVCKVQFFPPGSELNYRAGPDGEWVAIGVEEKILQSVAIRRLGRELDLPRTVISLDVPYSQRQVLDRKMHDLIDDPQPTREKIQSYLIHVAELLIYLRKKSAESLERRWKHRQRLLLRAEDFIRSNSERPFDVGNLATFVGTTPRSLQRHFLDAYGLTPKKWARCFSLHHARTQLLRADPRRVTVEGIAYDCGFRHMGRFARYYQELFGELPSVTLFEKRSEEKRSGRLIGVES